MNLQYFEWISDRVECVLFSGQLLAVQQSCKECHIKLYQTVMHRRLWKRFDYRLPRTHEDAFVFLLFAKAQICAYFAAKNLGPVHTIPDIFGSSWCNIIYSFSLFYWLLSGLSLFLRIFFSFVLRQLWVINCITPQMSHIFKRMRLPSTKNRQWLVLVAVIRKWGTNAVPCSV